MVLLTQVCPVAKQDCYTACELDPKCGCFSVSIADNSDWNECRTETSAGWGRCVLYPHTADFEGNFKKPVKKYTQASMGVVSYGRYYHSFAMPEAEVRCKHCHTGTRKLLFSSLPNLDLPCCECFFGDNTDWEDDWEDAWGDGVMIEETIMWMGG